MAKKLVIFCDGTWNKPETLIHKDGFLKRARRWTVNKVKSAFGKGNPLSPPSPQPVTAVTNVVKLMRAVLKTNAGTPQVSQYVRGLGTDGLWVSRALGAASGWGISRAITETYTFIVNNFEQGQDDIFLFGFSRGAYTARSLAGFIDKVGVIPKPQMHMLPHLYRRYMKSNDLANDPEFDRILQEIWMNNQESGKVEIPIYFIGVWDTVGSLGAPGMFRPLTKKYVRFHNTTLPSNVKYAYQALALHEIRCDFQPVFWTERTNPRQEVEQCWFAGSHSDVGGGGANDDLSNYALYWMANRAADRGLGLEPSCRAFVGDYTTTVEQSFVLPYTLRPAHKRPIREIDLRLSGYTTPKFWDTICVHRTAAFR